MSIPGFESVFSAVGNLRHEIEQKLQGKADSHEIHSLNRNVDSIENSIRSIQASLDGICSRMQELEAYRLEHQILHEVFHNTDINN